MRARDLLHGRLLAALLLSAFTALPPAHAGLEGEREQAGSLFDGNLPSAPPGADPSAADKTSATFEFLQQTKEVLSSGRWDGSVPEMRQFMFRNAKEGWTAQAQSVGLEGFLWTKKELEGVSLF